MLMMTPPLLRYFWFHSIYSHAASCSLRSAVCYEGFCDIKTKCEDESSRQDSSNKTVEPRHDLEAGLENIPHHDAEVHFDRGWAWVVCATTFLMEFFVGGLITSSGVIYAALVDEFNKSRAETGEKTFKYSGVDLA